MVRAFLRRRRIDPAPAIGVVRRAHRAAAGLSAMWTAALSKRRDSAGLMSRQLGSARP